MLLTVLDGAGVTQKVIVAAQEAVTDKSGSIAATGTAQTAIAANTLRSGYRIQNRSAVNPMYVNELGAASSGQQSCAIAPGAFFPPEGYPVTTSAISIMGTAGDLFAAREW